ncbi:MAG: dicarboxylate/amino acid:cation symporter [Actinobacteria bacterium]|nr:dicarboxylate/amino acid:cation symporter [Actinomycetota bacterium]
MANVHLLGDSISTPLLALVTLLIFKGCFPAFVTYLMFVFYFCTSMFAVSGIPGGGILVMLPILRTYLGFTPDMETVIIALYFLMDSFGTAANVMGDGALIIMVNKILKKLKLHE